MSEFFSEAADEVVGIAETGVNAVEGVTDAASGDWEGAADSSLSMSESALGVATGGVSEVLEQGWDMIADNTGLPSAHEALSEGTQAAGEALGDGMYDLVGQEHSYQAAMDFDDGNILSGLGEMAEGAGETVADTAESVGEDIADGAEELWDEITG